MSRAGKVAAPFVRQPGPRKKLTHFLSLRLLLPAGIPYSPPAADSWSPVSLASVASTLTPGSREADTALLVAHAQQRAVLRMAGTQDPEAPAHASRLADALRGLLVPPATLHLTLGLMDLAAPERLSLAQQTLRDLAPRMRHIVQASELPVQLGAIDVFSRPGDTPIPSQASVVFSSVPRPTNEPLFTLTELLVDTFVQAGLMDASFRKFHLHATLMKRRFDAAPDPIDASKVVGRFVFGTEPGPTPGNMTDVVLSAPGVQLCQLSGNAGSRFNTRGNFYVSDCDVDFAVREGEPVQDV